MFAVQPGRRTAIAGGVACVVSLGTGLSPLRSSSAGAGEAAPMRYSIDAMPAAKLATFHGAVKEMMDRSSSNPADPKGWLANAEPHRNFCAGLGAAGDQQIHYCYWFLPWHRAYLSVTEKKLREISGDSTLTIPYWNWTTSRRIPPAYLDRTSALSRARRFTENRALEDDEVGYIRGDPRLQALGVAALAATRFVARPSTDGVAMAREAATSLGGVPRPNAAGIFAMTLFERTPHGPVHVYVGGMSPDGMTGGDMTDFATAARDPLFFAHHGNLDRLWEIWRSVPANRATEPVDPEFTDRRFVFPWLDGSAIEIPVRDTLDTGSLGYSYDSLAVVSLAAGAATPESSLPRQRAIASADVSVPATPESVTASRGRLLLILEDVQSPGRALTAAVLLTARAAGSTQRVRVGNISVVRQSGEYASPGTLVFDVTAAAEALGTRDLKVIVEPNVIGGERRRPYTNLRIGSIRLLYE